ncbi:MAG: hypothetical protein IT516_17300 [Burkholderiales bacterium]|nr:hypothetical protein [Burkholderiales bacterium]
MRLFDFDPEEIALRARLVGEFTAAVPNGLHHILEEARASSVRESIKVDRWP